LSLRVLCIDDDTRLFELLASFLEPNGVVLIHAADGRQGLAALDAGVFDAVLLDVMMPGLDGLEVCRRIREKSRVPVIMLTAKGDETDRVVGLELGADDYVAKPFSPQELILRVGAVLRRVQQAPPAGKGGKVVRVGPFTVDTGAARAAVDGAELDLTPTEYRLLLTLMERRGRVQSRRQLLEAVWEVTANIATRTVDMHVQRLRNKVGEHADWIETVRGFGYRFRTEPPR
jgi:two-component system phosphate regulon response regulator PhoB